MDNIATTTTEAMAATSSSLRSAGSSCSHKDKPTVVKELKPTPTAPLDRKNDFVYSSTTCVVRSVMSLSQSVQQQQVGLYLDNVKCVGFELRKFLEAVDHLVPASPTNTHREVEMAHKVLSKDMSDLVSAMKLVEKYSNTTVEGEYRKGMLSSAHVLAMDAKHLLDVIDKIRMNYPHVNKLILGGNSQGRSSSYTTTSSSQSMSDTAGGSS